MREKIETQYLVDLCIHFEVHTNLMCEQLDLLKWFRRVRELEQWLICFRGTDQKKERKKNWKIIRSQFFKLILFLTIRL